MNKWECSHPGCKNSVVGTGSAIGLRAIGWYFEVGPRIFCPAHRPDGIPCHNEPDEEGRNGGEACVVCASEQQAYTIQRTLVRPDEKQWFEGVGEEWHEEEKEDEQEERPDYTDYGVYERYR